MYIFKGKPVVLHFRERPELRTHYWVVEKGQHRWNLNPWPHGCEVMRPFSPGLQPLLSYIKYDFTMNKLLIPHSWTRDHYSTSTIIHNNNTFFKYAEGTSQPRFKLAHSGGGSAHNQWQSGSTANFLHVLAEEIWCQVSYPSRTLAGLLRPIYWAGVKKGLSQVEQL